MKFLPIVIMFFSFFTSNTTDEVASLERDFQMIDEGALYQNISQYLDSSFTFAATGDILVHDYLYEDVMTEDGYDFTSRVETVAPYLQQQDLVF